MDMNLISSLLGSSMAGMVARLVCHPIDTIKSKLQSGKPEYSRLVSTVYTTMTKEGFRGFFKGVGAVVIGGIPGVSIYLTSYDQTKILLTKNGIPVLVTSLSSGMIAEAISCVVFVPVDVIKERLQVQSPLSSGNIVYSKKHSYSSSFDALQKILKSEGLRGIYRGYGATLLSYGPYSALYFMLYEMSKDYVLSRYDPNIVSDNKAENRPHELTFYHSLLCAAISGAVSSFVTSPLDMAKLRIQIKEDSDPTSRGGSRLLLQLKKIYSTGGFRELFRGATTRVLFHTPSAAITMALYEECKRFWGSILIS